MITPKLQSRCEGTCELCNNGAATVAYAVSPKSSDAIENEVALCYDCLDHFQREHAQNYWRCLAGSIWNVEPSVQALSYRILHRHQKEEWARDIIVSVELDEQVIHWALTAFEKKELHKDSNGIELTTGDTVVLTQALNVKGTNFSAPKGTIVRKIRLVPGNVEQIEGKINEQTIVILTKYVRKSS
ncbi:PhnA domain-containing protein [Niabella sp. CC-SYL272]|uniref:alkylphosphonate utilization protein n=1 Tax=Niabella agricola TaxID=2891571 RepID=UPI001F2F3ECC|nr:alkylphosphonate utilization protein [Niabella agricola]MCF3108337.1 PhnA domain-containing protein [Niabella agricola]